MDTRTIKPEDNKAGTFGETLDADEVTSVLVSPVPTEAPGIIWAVPGTAEEEAIYFREKNDGAGTISGLIRDYTNLNGGVGREHLNGTAWEVLQSAQVVKNLIDAIQEGYTREQSTIARVDTDEFTVSGDRSGFYTVGRVLRFNQDNTKIGTVLSSSYNAGTTLTTVQVDSVVVPDPLTSVEISIMPKNYRFLTAADLIDEDDFASDSATKAPTQQSVKAYVDNPERIITLTPGFIKPTTTAGCADPEKKEMATNDIDYDVLAFDKDTDENAYANFQMPDTWDGGVIQFRYIWTALAGTAAENVVLELSGRAFANDDAMDQAVGTPIEVSDALITTGDLHVSAWSADVTLAGSPAPGQWVHTEIMRDVSEDNLAADALLIGIQIKYKQTLYSE